MFRNVLLMLAAALSVCPFVGCKAKSNAKYRIAVIPKGQTHEFWQSIERGARAAREALAAEGVEVELIWDAPLKESDAQDQIARVQRNVASRGVHGLVLAPQDSKAMVPVVEQSVEKGVKVVIIDSDLAKPELYVKYVATHNYNGGRLAADHLLAVLAKDDDAVSPPRKGTATPKLVLFRYQTGSESTEQREKGFLDRVAEVAAAQKKADPDAATVKVINDKHFSGATVESAQKAAPALLGLVKKEADGIFAVNESATTGLLNEMRSQGLALTSKGDARKIALMGFDSSGPLRQAVEEGDVVGVVVQDPYKMGFLGVWTLARSLEGDDVSAGGKEQSTGEHLVTKANVGEQAVRELFDPKLQTARKIDRPALGKKP